MQVDKRSSEKNASVGIFLFYFIYLFFIKNNLSTDIYIYSKINIQHRYYKVFHNRGVL